jgi:hypothetical protein
LQGTKHAESNAKHSTATAHRFPWLAHHASLMVTVGSS